MGDKVRKTIMHKTIIIRWFRKSSHQNTGNKFTDEILFCILIIYFSDGEHRGFRGVHCGVDLQHGKQDR